MENDKITVIETKEELASVLYEFDDIVDILLQSLKTYEGDPSAIEYIMLKGYMRELRTLRLLYRTMDKYWKD